MMSPIAAAWPPAVRRRVAALVAGIVFLVAATPADAIVRGGSAGGLGRHVVKLIGRNLLCSATVVGRSEVLTSAHCIDGSDPYFVVAGGARIRVTGHSGYGGATMLTLARPLPRGYAPIETGSGSGATVIAGYGSAAESSRPRSAGLRGAHLVEAGSGALVDPRRRGASACLGDSGGPVARFDGRRYVLVGIIERASNPSPTRACGHLTHFVTVGNIGSWFSSGASAGEQAAASPRKTRRHRRR